MEVADLTPLVTPEFHYLADFANFRHDEVAMLRGFTHSAPRFIDAVTDSIEGCLAERLAAVGVAGQISRPALREWLARSSIGPFDGEFAGFLRGLTHRPDGVTFPGFSEAMAPQVIVAAMAWVQGQILVALGNLTDTIALSGLGGIWMDQLMLQLGIILEPVLGNPSGPRDYHGGHDALLHPYANLAGFGAAEGRMLEVTGAHLAPLASGVSSLAYTYLLSRPESAGFLLDADHLAQRKQTLMAWWIRTAADPNDPDADFGNYMRRVANAHVRNAGTHPEVQVPAQLTIALMGWVEMRVMTALNAVSVAGDGAGSGIFGLFGDPEAVAGMGRAWMTMLTLQLGVLIDPYLTTS